MNARVISCADIKYQSGLCPQPKHFNPLLFSGFYGKTAETTDYLARTLAATKFEIRNPKLEIRNSKLEIRMKETCLSFDVHYSLFDIRYSLSDDKKLNALKYTEASFDQCFTVMHCKKRA